MGGTEGPQGLRPVAIVLQDSIGNKGFEQADGVFARLIRDYNQHSLLKVVNRAYDGYTVKMIQSALDLLVPVCSGDDRAEVWIVNFGANDSCVRMEDQGEQEDERGQGPNQSVRPSEYRDLMRQLIKRIRGRQNRDCPTVPKKRVDVLVTTTIPNLSTMMRRSEQQKRGEDKVLINRSVGQVKYFNELLKRVIGDIQRADLMFDDEDGQVELLDMYAVFESHRLDESIYTDGLHLTKKGYGIMYDTYKAALKSAFGGRYHSESLKQDAANANVVGNYQLDDDDEFGRPQLGWWRVEGRKLMELDSQDGEESEDEMYRSRFPPCDVQLDTPSGGYE